jgi:glutamate carboxypeptidase
MQFTAAHQWLDSQYDNMIADLIRLCNQNSGSANLAGLREMGDVLESWASLSPATFTRIELPSRKAIDANGDVMCIESAPALRWDYQLDKPRRVLLAIHYDTVFGPDSEFQKCIRVDDQRLNGPGVADAKGGIVVLRYALQALLKHALVPDLGWTLILNPDEELGSPSSAGIWHCRVAVWYRIVRVRVISPFASRAARRMPVGTLSTVEMPCAK